MERTNNNELKYANVDIIEIGLTNEDVESCAIPCADNTSSCKEVAMKEYVKEQLSNYTDTELANAVKYYGIDHTEFMMRLELTTYIVWIAAWDIVDCEE